MNTLKYRCIDGITANEQRCRMMVHNSIGLVTALVHWLGYEASNKLAKEALETGESVYSPVLKQKLLSEKDFDKILSPGNMIRPGK